MTKLSHYLSLFVHSWTERIESPGRKYGDFARQFAKSHLPHEPGFGEPVMALEPRTSRLDQVCLVVQIQQHRLVENGLLGRCPRISLDSRGAGVPPARAGETLHHKLLFDGPGRAAGPRCGPTRNTRRWTAQLAERDHRARLCKTLLTPSAAIRAPPHEPRRELGPVARRTNRARHRRPICPPPATTGPGDRGPRH
jgi:hypothetical protein